MALVDQWDDLERSLGGGRSDVELELTLMDDDGAERAVSYLAPLAPGRSGRRLRLYVSSAGVGPGPGALRRALTRLDRERVEAQLELLSSAAPEAARAARPTRPLARQWEARLAELAPDWSDLHCEVELTSSDHLEASALLIAPLNPTRLAGTNVLRFRVARSFGYGAAPGMVGRCLTRVDEAAIPGTFGVLRALSDSKPVGTQGPVWYVGGRVV